MKKGFTLIELLAVIVILAVIALIATPIILGIISDSKKQAFKNMTYGIAQAAKNNYIEAMYSSGAPTDVTFTYTNGEETSSVEGQVLDYEGARPESGVVSLTSTGNVAIALYDGTNCAHKSFSDSEVIVEATTLANCTYEYSVSKGVNEPKLVTGMTPIKWNGTSWVETTISDKDWYNYDNTNKKWANAKTADGSMWVWIPRYVYRITSGWHDSTAGAIEVQFSKGTEDDWNDSITLSSNTTADASNNTWTTHPGFTFGTTELAGIWIAKFEASGTTASLDVKPGVVFLDNITLGNMFTASRNMEINNKYGWPLASGLNANGTFTIDTNNLDSHMIKNVEWGVTTYLAQSIYGKNAEVSRNSSVGRYTGGGADNAYVTNVAQSTTGTIYGIYDMSGGAYEYVMGNYNSVTGSSGLNPNNINAAYVDIYTGYNNTMWGDAIYETSNASTGTASWYSDFSYMNSSDGPWFVRGGRFDGLADTGLYSFFTNTGGTSGTYGFRPVLVVASGL